MATPSADYPVGKPVTPPPGRATWSRSRSRRWRVSPPYPAVARAPVNWRAVGAVAALLLIIDSGLICVFVGLAQDFPHLVPFSAAPAAGRPAGGQPALAKRDPEPPPFVFKRRDRQSADELSRQLLAAPELDLDTEPGTSARLVADARRGDARFAHPVFEPLLRRPDLHGLPIAMGADCQLGRDAAVSLQGLSQELRMHLSQCGGRANMDGRIDATGLRQRLLQGDNGNWGREDALPTLVQMLQPEDPPVRLLLVGLLARMPGRAASAALAGRAVFDLSPEVREAAVRALKERPRDEYRQPLLDGLRYPWAPAADHAAEALVALNDRQSLPSMAELLGRLDPAGPVPRAFHDIDPARLGAQEPGRLTAVALDERQGGERRTRLMAEPGGLPPSVKASPGEVYAVREVVRVNHLRNCLLCHPPSLARTDPVRGAVPSPGRPLEPPARAYDGDPNGSFVRADVTYLRQDFSVAQPVDRPGKWPAYQRYDYLVRTRYPTEDELAKKAPATYPQREAVRWALRELGAAAGD